jgi:predicted 3-demethylubiquinone-9 3-methyltransferase (glyoxalase superfamily)
MQKITPFLWFDGRAEEAMEFYVGIFPDSRRGRIMRYSGAGPGVPGSVLSATFELEGVEFTALNGPRRFEFSPAVSFFIHCASQAEVDRCWDALLEGGKAMQCGWLSDKFGITWQIVPEALGDMLAGDPVRAARVMQAAMPMVKLDLATLQRAYDGE